MVYGYIRVSTDRQTVDNQRFEIERFCSQNDMVIDQWIEETISGTQLPEKRLLGPLLDEVKTGDLIVCSELSRLGRSLFMIMSILNYLLFRASAYK
jgi:DNA invertase Pin-like site-specific DNA recombinase